MPQVQALSSRDTRHEEGSEPRRVGRGQEAATLIVLFLFVFTVYSRSGGAVPMTDMVWTVPIALSLIHEGNLDLDEYPYAHGDGRLRDVGGHSISFFPTSPSVVIAPVVVIVENALRGAGSLDLYEHLKSAPDWELVARLNQGIASLFAALTVLVVYLIGRLSLGRPMALLLAVVSALGTSVWSTASRDLWQHTISAFAVALFLYLLLRAQDRSALALFWCGLAVAVAYVTRPTNSLLVLLATAYVLVEYRHRVAFYLLGAAVVAVPFVLYNLDTFGSILAPYYQPDRLGNNPFFLEALAGNLISPSRGLLVYSPVLLFAGYGFALKVRNGQFQRLDAFLAAATVLHWLAISSFRHWWGGASYGPRFFTDLLPISVYFLIPVLDQMAEPAFWARWPGRVIGVLFVVSIAWSLFVHYRGSTQMATWAWNGAYPKVVLSVDEAPARLWDWSDPQFWRGLRPAAADIEPRSLCITLREGDAAASNSALTILNRGDKPFTWTLETPYRVFQQPAYNQVPGLGYGESRLAVDVAGCGVGDHSLGALYLTAYTEDNQQVRNSPLIVPMTLRVLPADASDSELEAVDSDSCATAPSDILVEGQVQELSGNSLFGVYGPGWYDVETAGEASWRWATSPARIFVFAPQRQVITFSSTPIALHDEQAANGFGERGTMRVSVHDRPMAEFDMQVGQPLVMKISLQPGWNVVSLELLAGNVRPVDLDPSTGDTRLLSFALGPIEIHE